MSAIERLVETASRIAAPRDEAEAGEMGKKIFGGAPGESGVGDAVRAWLDGQGIDPAMVIGYSIFQHVGEVPRIMLEMYFEDPPLAAGGVVPRGTEIVVTHPGAPAPTVADVNRAVHLQGEHAKGKIAECPLCYPPYDPSAPDHQTESDER